MKGKLKIAMLLDVSRAYDRALMTGVTGYNKIHDKFTFFSRSPHYVQSDGIDLVQRVIEWKPDGIIAREVVELQPLFRLNIPIIVAPHTGLYPGHVNIWGNNFELGEQVAGYFIARGYKHFGMLCFRNFQWSLERQEGFMRRVRQSGGITQTLAFDCCTQKWEDLPGKLAAWLGRLPRPCALFSVVDELSLLLLEAARMLGARVPDDFSILGVDNDTLLCETASPALSSMEYNAEKGGFEAAAALTRWIETGDRPADNIIVPSGRVHTRTSTNALAIDDQQVRTALHFITNAAAIDDVSVDDVVRATTVSRRVLEKRFQQLLRSSILDEIKKVRIGKIKLLLERSDLTVQQIACELNFRNFENITRYFRQSTGVSPMEYRCMYKQSVRPPTV